MNDAERDELLIRMDERLKALKDGDEGHIPEIEKLLKKQNGRIRKLEVAVVALIIGGAGGGYGLVRLLIGG